MIPTSTSSESTAEISRHVSAESPKTIAATPILRRHSHETRLTGSSFLHRRFSEEFTSRVASASPTISRKISCEKEFTATAPTPTNATPNEEKTNAVASVHICPMPIEPISLSSMPSPLIPKPRLSFCEGVKFDKERLHRLRTIVEGYCNGRISFYHSPDYERRFIQMAFDLLNREGICYEDKIYQLSSMIAVYRLFHVFVPPSSARLESIVSLEERNSEAIAQVQIQEILAYAQRHPYSDVDLAYDEYLFRSYSQNKGTQVHATFCAVKMLLARPKCYMGLIGLASLLAKSPTRPVETTNALCLVNRAIALYPDATGPYVLAGNLYKKAYRFQMAMESFQSALNRNVTLFEHFNEIGQLHEINDLSLTGHLKAVEFQEAILAKFQKPETKLRLEILLIRGLLIQGKYSEAKNMNFQLFRNKDQEIFWWYEAQIAIAQNKLDAAEDALDVLEEVAVSDTLIHHTHGLLGIASGEADEALDQFMDIISMRTTLSFKCGVQLCLPLSVPLACCRMILSMPNPSDHAKEFIERMLHEILSFEPEHPEANAMKAQQNQISRP